jgi:hypothetical protein
MPYRKIKKGANKGNYVSLKSGKVRTLGQIRAMHANKKKKK